MNDIEIRQCTAETLPGHLDGLALLLHAAVTRGASVGFVLPFALADSLGFWRQQILPAVRHGDRLLWIALKQGDRVGGEVVGTVQLVVGLPANQPHRSEVAKLLVHPAHRKQGIAKSLMAALEQHASELGKQLLTLDTKTGDSAERLYRSLGYRTAGVIPGYCLDALTRQPDSTTYMYKALLCVQNP